MLLLDFFSDGEIHKPQVKVFNLVSCEVDEEKQIYSITEYNELISDTDITILKEENYTIPHIAGVPGGAEYPPIAPTPAKILKLVEYITMPKKEISNGEYAYRAFASKTSSGTTGKNGSDTKQPAKSKSKGTAKRVTKRKGSK